MFDTEFDRLLAGLCDGSLGDDDMCILGERIANSPADRQAYLEYLDLHASLLGEAPFAGVTESLGELEVPLELPQRTQRSALSSRGAQILALSLATILLAIGGVVWWNQPATAPGPGSFVQREPWARITDVVGSVELAGVNEPLQSGVDLSDDQTVRTGSDDSYAVIELADGGRLLLCPDSQLRLTRDMSASQRRLVLSAGVLEADVPKLKDDQQLIVVTPQAEIAVGETHCVVSAADASSTAIETSRGQVSVLRTADGKQAEVPAGYYAVALHEVPAFEVRPVAQLPTQPHAQFALEQARILTFRGQQQLVAASATQLALFDRATHEPVSSFQEPVQTTSLNKENNHHLISAAKSGLVGQIDRTGIVRMIDPATGSETLLDTGIRNSNSAALDETGQLLAISDRRSGWYSAARLWDLNSRTEMPAIEILGSVRHLALSRDGRQVALSIERTRGFEYHRLEIWNVSPPEMVHRLPLPDRSLRVLAFSPDGSKLAGANDRGNVTVWEVRSASELGQRGHSAGWAQPLTALAFDPSGDLLAAGTNNGRVRLWNVTTDQELGVLTCGTRIISALAYSPDGEELAVGAVRGNVLLYRLTSGQSSPNEL